MLDILDRQNNLITSRHRGDLLRIHPEGRVLPTHTCIHDRFLPGLVGTLWRTSFRVLDVKNIDEVLLLRCRITVINLKCGGRAVIRYFVIPKSQPL